MTTAHSPLRQLRAQARLVAAKLKAAERGDIVFKEGARERPCATFSIAMDDKILRIEMPWATIRATSEDGIAEYILRYMRGQRETLQ